MSSIPEKQPEGKLLNESSSATISPRSAVQIPDIIQFHYDSEDDEKDSSNHAKPEEDEESQYDGRLHWDMDPEVSFSDWKIEISYQEEEEEEEEDCDEETNKETRATTTCRSSSKKTKTCCYHVHKSVLAVGVRRSEYFVRLFRHATASAKKIRSSRLWFSQTQAVKEFPTVLNYLYYPERPLLISTENASALQYLGSHLEMKQLKWEAKQFRKQDLSMDTLAVYYPKSHLFHDEKLLRSIVKFCSRNISHISTSHELLQITSPAFWLQVLSKLDQNDVNQSLHISELLSQFCKLHSNDIDDSMLEQLVDHLPRMTPEAALTFLALPRTTDDDDDELVGFQLRCIDVVASRWSSVDFLQAKSFLCHQHPLLLSELLARSLERAQETSTILEHEVASSVGFF